MQTKNDKKNYENSVFRVIFEKKRKEKKERLGSGPFPRDGRVTGNKALFCLGLSRKLKLVGTLPLLCLSLALSLSYIYLASMTVALTCKVGFVQIQSNMCS